MATFIADQQEPSIIVVAVIELNNGVLAVPI